MLPGHSLDVDRDDLLHVCEVVGARRVFGHSYGSLVVLQAAAVGDGAVDRVAVYEPAVSIDGAIPTAWVPRYRELLAKGDRRGAFAFFVQKSGQAAGPVSHLPLWYLRAVLRVVLGRRWRQMDPLLEANAVEHELVAGADGDVGALEAITADVLLLGGSRSPTFMTEVPFGVLEGVVPRCRSAVIDGLDHLAPDDKAPASVAADLLQFL